MSMALKASQYGSRGFTLLEVIVAFAILALSLGVVYQLFGQSMKAADLSGQYAEATIVAQSLLAEVGISMPLEAGTRHGRIDTYQWQVIIRPLEAPVFDEIAPTSYAVEVRVGWADNDREISLNSIRLRNTEE